jgi:MtN3 and saliva related transmembrane protein
MNIATILGLIAAFCTTVSFVPQVHKIWKTKETKDLSLLMYSILGLGLVLWLVYGIMLGNLPIIIANAISLALVTFVLVLKIKYG